MPFSAFSLHRHQPAPGKQYLLDANVWIYLLEADLELKNADNRAIQYIDFLTRIKQAGSNTSKVVLPAIVLSEVINRLLRSYYFLDFKDKNPDLFISGDEKKKRNPYKHIYREHDQFGIDYGVILSNILSYHSILQFSDDAFSQLTIREIVAHGQSMADDSSNKLDFNDFLLLQIAQRNEYIFVTEDADFAGQDIAVVTMNRSILNWRPRN